MSEEVGTRQRLLDAAIGLIEADGEAAVRVDVVAQMALITKPSIYHFFGDREGLIVAAQTERYRRAARFGQDELIAAASLCVSQAEFKNVLARAMEITEDSDSPRRRAIRVEVQGSAISRQRLQAEVIAVDASVSEELAEMFELAKAKGWIQPQYDLGTLVRWWFSLMLGRHALDNDVESGRSAEWSAITRAAVWFLLFGHEHSDGDAGASISAVIAATAPDQ